MGHSNFSPEQVPNAALDLEEEAVFSSNPADYVEDIRQKYRYKPFMKYYVAMAHVAQPLQGERDNDADYTSATSFLRGELLALRAADLARGEVFAANLCRVVKLPPHVRPREEGGSQQELAAVINVAAEDGFRLATPYHGLLDRWSSDISPDPLQAPCIKRGFGVVMFMANAAMLVEAACEEQADLLLMESQLASPIDWDAGLRNLLG